jgi:hypothetical protein
MLPEVLDMAEEGGGGSCKWSSFGIQYIEGLGKKSWTGLLDSFPLVHLLTKGWFMLKFQSVADVAKVLKAPWCIDSTSLLLKRWTSFFMPVMKE